MSNNKLINKLLVVTIIALLIGFGIGYSLTGINMVPREEYEALQEEYNAIAGLVPKTNVKAGFIYIGPIGDYGWSHAHDEGRKYVDTKFPWLDTVYIESVPAADVDRYIDRLIEEEKCDIIFTTSFDFMDGTIKAAEKYPDKIFFHCSGYMRSNNVGTYFADFYQIYYLNGLMAGALTKTGKVGYVGAYSMPEVVRHINAFTLGVREVNPDATVSVRWIDAWYDPEKAREAAEALIAEGCDALAFTEDSPTVLQVGQEHTEVGEQIYTFSHYSPMQKFAPDSCVSGQLVHWEKLYEEIITRVYLGIHNNTNLADVDYLYNLKEGGVELGGDFNVPINEKFVTNLKAVTVTEPILGEINVYDLVMIRLEQMTEPSVVFDPFTGPIKDQYGVVRIPDGKRGTYLELWNIDWFVEGVIGT